MKTLITGTLAALTLFAGMSPLSAADADANATAITVWVDGQGQSSMADKANKKHAEMAAALSAWTILQDDGAPEAASAAGPAAGPPAGSAAGSGDVPAGSSTVAD